MKKKSKLNKTIDFDLSEAATYLKDCYYYQKGSMLRELENKIICGDSFEVLENLSNMKFDLIIVDPPYNLYKNYHGNTFKKRNTVDYLEYTKKWVDLVYPLLSNTGSLYVCCDWASSMTIGEVLAESFIIKNRITWQREKGRGSKKNWKNSMEDIWFCTKSEEYVFNIEDVMMKKRVVAPYTEEGRPKDWVESKEGRFRRTHPSNLWTDITVPFWSMAENTAHPTQKPEKLLAKLILASSNEDDLVLDIFGGAGSTAVTCKKLNRRFVSIEQNELYCAWSLARLKKAEEDSSIQGYIDGEFLERNF